jgi:histidinol phosphatase-like enzyme
LPETARDHHLGLKKCAFVGVTLKDLEVGNGVGCRTILAQTGQGRETLKKIFQGDNPGSNFRIAGNLFRSVDLIIRLMNSIFQYTREK